MGGFIVTYLIWRWIFYINVPIGLLGIVLVSLFIANTRGEVPEKTDYKGIFLSSLSLGLLLFGFELISHDGDGCRWRWPSWRRGRCWARFISAMPATAKDPILDISLMKIPTFGTSVIAGAITRLTQGAHPYLLPLMMQLGFGLSAAQSRPDDLGHGAGLHRRQAGGARAAAPLRLSRHAGGQRLFRQRRLCGVRPVPPRLAAAADVRDAWCCSGFFMSIQFTGYNTIAYDEVSQQRMGAATSFYTTFQQLMLSMGICAGAIALRVGMAATRQPTPRLSDFTLAFSVVTAISALAAAWNLRFAADAGAAMSGRPQEAGA